MNTITELLPAFAAGAVLGAVQYAGLWFTVGALARASRPGLLLATSTVLRIAIIVAGLYVVMDGHWEKLLAAVAGVTLARVVMVHSARANTAPGSTG